MSSQSQSSNPGGFRPDVEGLRAIAILLVVGYHVGLPGGYIGVDVFFVLSGYLISRLLVDEVERTGTVNLIGFYSRRLRRLLPAFVLVLLVTVCASAILHDPSEQHDLAGTAVWTAAYGSNLYFVRTATNYLAAEAAANPLLHTWSLSVEEQFYAVWPLFILVGLGVFTRHGPDISRRRLIAYMTGTAAVSFAVCLYLMDGRQHWAFFASPSRGWEFALGGVAALTFEPRVDRGSMTDRLRVPSFLGWIGIAGIATSAAVFNDTTYFPGLAAVLPVLSTVFVLGAGASHTDTWLTRGLGLRGLQHIGRLSYSWYLWHWPVLVFAATIVPELPLSARLALLMIAFVLAHVSYRLVENPIRYHSRLTSHPWQSLAFAAILTTVALSVSLAWRQVSLVQAGTPSQLRYTHARADAPALYRNKDCYNDIRDVDVRECSFGPAQTTASIVLFGDSHAAQWFPALERASLTHGWRLIPLTKSGCPAVDESKFEKLIGRRYTECDEWRRAALQRILEIRPALIIVASSRAQLYSSDQWRLGTVRILGRLSPATRQIIIIKDLPFARYDVPSCLARLAWHPTVFHRLVPSCAFPAWNAEAEHVYAQQVAATKGFVNVSTIDMGRIICPGGTCQPESGGTIIYRDRSHLTNTFATRLAPVLVDEITRAIHERDDAANNPILGTGTAPGH